MAVSHLFVAHNFNRAGPQSAGTKVYQNISKHIQDVSKISKMNTKYQAAAGPARPKPGPSPGPRGRGSRAGPCAAPGLGRAWAGPGRRPLGSLYPSWISWIYLGYIWIYFWYIFLPADWGPIWMKQQMRNCHIHACATWFCADTC